ncbi:MAG: molecular chaperone DnaJ [Leptolyngbyaceae bacterium]|nr:molecular chaperone DnaJ [Leptolyngbyaceae bacterium]
MQEHYDRLGISPGAPPADLKAAYHAKLKEFPAHSHPQEFKAIRAAYEAIRKAPKSDDDFFTLSPIKVELDETLLNQLEERAIAAADVTINDLILLTF